MTAGEMRLLKGVDRALKGGTFCLVAYLLFFI